MQHVKFKRLLFRIGTYQRTGESNQVIGDINPDWKAGVFNTFKYKNLSLGFLIDIQKGGSVFSLDTWYGYATGMYDWSAGTNELGNPIRDVVTGTPGNYGADTGGLIVDGVAPDGTKNEVRANFNIYANPYGYARAPNALHVYDAGYVKLREANLTYNFDQKFIDKFNNKSSIKTEYILNIINKTFSWKLFESLRAS